MSSKTLPRHGGVEQLLRKECQLIEMIIKQIAVVYLPCSANACLLMPSKRASVGGYYETPRRNLRLAGVRFDQEQAYGSGFM